MADDNEQQSGQQNGQSQDQGQQNGAQKDQNGGDNKQGQKEDDKPEKKKRKIPPFVIIGVVALVLVVAGLFYWHSTYYEDTDDAQVSGDIDQLSTRVAGHVISVNVEEQQKVEKGQLLMTIDASDYSVSEASAKANVASALAAWNAAKENVPVQAIQTSSAISGQEANVRSAGAQIDQAQKQLDSAVAQVAANEANAKKARLDVERYTPLVEKDVISKQQYDQAVATSKAYDATVNQAQAQVSAQQQQVRVSRDKLLQAQADLRNAQAGPKQVEVQKSKADQAEAQYEQAKAQYDQAALNFGYTQIYAPYAGIISKKNVQVGQNVAVGQAAMTLVSLDNLWVEANFKETQLEHMRPGQTVKVKVDAYDTELDAKISQVGGATGSMLSLFPPENATGNYVKVVQRVPVRIDFTNLRQEDPGYSLRPGMSVVPKVRIK